MSMISKDLVLLKEFCQDTGIPESRMRQMPQRRALRKVGNKVYVSKTAFNQNLANQSTPPKMKGGKRTIKSKNIGDKPTE